MADSLKQIKQLQKELADLKKGLSGFKDIKLDNFNEASKDVKSLNTDIAAASALLKDLQPDLDYIVDSFTESIDALQKSNYYISLNKKGLKGLASQASDILRIKQGELDTDAKSIKKQQEKQQAHVESLKLSAKDTTLSKQQRLAIANQVTEAEQVAEGFKDVLKVNKDINKQLGAGPALAGGIDKALQKIGLPSLGINDAVTETQALGQSAAASGKKFKAMPAFLGKVGSSIKGAFTKANILQASIALVTEGLLAADKGTANLARGLGISMEASKEMRKDFGQIASLSNNLNITTKGLQESQLAITAATGTRAQLNEADLVTMTNMVKTMGFQHDELMGIQKLSLSQGKSLDDNTKEILGGARAYASRNKLVVNEKEILKEVNKASASLKLSLGGGGQAIAEAAVQAKQFGINLEQAESIASSLLDFESSIENELSAELITGKNLNLERARGLALNGDAVGAASEMLKQVGGTAEFTKMNVIQQEALAKAVGMTREGLAGSLIESEALAKMSAVEGKTALERYNNEIKSGKSKSDMVKMLGEEAAAGLEAQSNQEKFNASVEKLKEIFVQVGNVIMPIFDLLGNIAEIIVPAISFALTPIFIMFEGLNKILSGSISELSIMEGILGGIAAIYLAITGYQKLSSLYTSLTKKQTTIQVIMEKSILAQKTLSNAMEKKGIIFGMRKLGILAMQAAVYALANPFKALLGIAAAVGVGAAAASIMSDGVIGPGGETVVSGPKGSIQVDKEDSMIVGTDLGGKKKPGKPSGEGGGSVNVDMSQTNALLQQLIGVIQSGGTVTLDGQAVGAALKLGSYEVQ